MIAERPRLGDWLVSAQGGPAYMVVDWCANLFVCERKVDGQVRKIIFNVNRTRPATNDEIPK